MMTPTPDRDGAPKLLPCPFCGSTDVGVRPGSSAPEYWVGCNRCGASSDTSSFDRTPVKWNTRATLPAADARAREAGDFASIADEFPKRVNPEATDRDALRFIVANMPAMITALRIAAQHFPNHPGGDEREAFEKLRAITNSCARMLPESVSDELVLALRDFVDAWQARATHLQSGVDPVEAINDLAIQKLRAQEPPSPAAGLTEDTVLLLIKKHLRLLHLFHPHDGSYDKTIVKPDSLTEAAKAIVAASLTQPNAQIEDGEIITRAFPLTQPNAQKDPAP